MLLSGGWAGGVQPVPRACILGCYGRQCVRKKPQPGRDSSSYYSGTSNNHGRLLQVRISACLTGGRRRAHQEAVRYSYSYRSLLQYSYHSCMLVRERASREQGGQSKWRSSQHGRARHRSSRAPPRSQHCSPLLRRPTREVNERSNKNITPPPPPHDTRSY